MKREYKERSHRRRSPDQHEASHYGATGEQTRRQEREEERKELAKKTHTLLENINAVLLENTVVIT